MAGDGIDLVLRRLAHFGCDPRRAGDATWEAQCPVHGGAYYALLVSRGADRSVSLNCRYRDFKGKFCPASELWESIGLDPRQFAGGQVAIAPPQSACEARSQSPATNGLNGAPGRDCPSQEPVNPLSTEESAESSWRCAVTDLVCAVLRCWSSAGVSPAWQLGRSSQELSERWWSDGGPVVPPSAAPSRPVNLGRGDLVLLATCLYSAGW